MRASPSLARAGSKVSGFTGRCLGVSGVFYISRCTTRGFGVICPCLTSGARIVCGFFSARCVLGSKGIPCGCDASSAMLLSINELATRGRCLEFLSILTGLHSRKCDFI